MSDCCNPGHTSQIKRLNRIAGQVEGVRKMIEDNRYCPDIINQILSTSSALKSLGAILLKKHIENCVYDAFNSDNKKEKDAKVNELIKIYTKNL